MISNYCLDTNVLIALHELHLFDRWNVAVPLASSPFYASAQVVSEYINVLQRVYNKPKTDILPTVVNNLAPAAIIPVTKNTLIFADKLSGRYQFQIFDAIIVANALEAGCTTLYTEDMQHNQLIEGRLRIVNPFL